MRLDHNGVEINKKNKKKVQISFIDAISTNQLVTIISVDNFKEYNYVSMPSLEDIYVKSKTTCACVIYFLFINNLINNFLYANSVLYFHN